MKILFVAMANSIHTSRWIDQIVDQGWDIRLFPVDDLGINPEIRNVTIYNYFNYRPLDLDKSVKLLGSWPLSRGLNFTKYILQEFWPSRLERDKQLVRIIRKFRPDIIHSLEMQHAGYLTYESREKMPNYRFPIWIYSSWGSDLYYFGKKPEHKLRITNVLKTCNYYISDCERDIALAKDFGFQGKTLGVFPVGGGFDLNSIARICKSDQTSSRKIIALKGLHPSNWVGRALIALHALYLCSEHLMGYEIVIYYPSSNVINVAKHYSTITGIPITILPQGPHIQVLKLMSRARIAIGLSTSDGVPNTMLEAMIMGAFPIQSDTISTAEWINHGKNGLLVPPEDPESVADAIQQAISDDNLVNRAAEINRRITLERIDRSKIQSQVIDMYKKIEDKI